MSASMMLAVLVAFVAILQGVVGTFDGTLVWTQTDEITTGQTAGFFSSSISLLNNISVVGSYGQTSGTDASVGAAYVYEFVGGTEKWSQTQILTPDTPTANLLFGGSSALTENWLAIGATGYNNQEGEVFTYTVGAGGNTFQFAQAVTASAPQSQSLFGTSIALFDNTMFVGAPAATSGAGIVYVFEYTTQWTQIGELHGNDTVATAAYGSAVSATEGWLAVGAPGDMNKNQAVGLVYIYKASSSSATGYELLQTLTPNAANTFGHFGLDLDISNGNLIVGDTTNGQVYIFQYQPLNAYNWVLNQMLTSSSNDFGASVELSINSYMQLALVGAPGASAAYVYFMNNNVWTMQQMITVGGSSSQQFAYEAAIQNSTILLSATGENNDQGALFIYNGRQTTYSPTAAPTSAVPTTSPTFAPTTSSVWYGSYSTTGTAGSNYGQSCSLSPLVGSTTFAVVGSPTGGSSGAGQVYVYTSTNYKTWDYFSYIDPYYTTGTNFGLASSMSKDFLVVGMPGYDGTMTSSGAAYVYQLSDDSYNYQQTLFPSDAVSFGQFGKAISITSELLFVGAPFAGANSQGKVYIYTLVGSVWPIAATLLSPEIDTDSAAYGWAISAYTDDDTIVAISAPGQVNSGTTAKGAVFVYIYDNNIASVPQSIGTIVCPDPTVTNLWGSSVAAGVVQYGPSKGQYFVAIGSPNSIINGIQSGAVYIYNSPDGTTWTRTDILTPIDASAGAEFGYSVTWDQSADQALMIGAPFGAATAGMAYVFNNQSSGWVQTASLSYSPSVAESGFGTSVCMVYGAAIVGSPSGDIAHFYVDTSLPTLAPTSDNHSDSTLSPGAIAGVVIGVLAAVAIGAGLAYFLFFAKASDAQLTQPLAPKSNYGDVL